MRLLGCMCLLLHLLSHICGISVANDMDSNELAVMQSLQKFVTSLKRKTASSWRIRYVECTKWIVIISQLFTSTTNKLRFGKRSKMMGRIVKVDLVWDPKKGFYYRLI